MGLEELLSDRDSEDELDEDLATVEDRRVYISYSCCSCLVCNVIMRGVDEIVFWQY
jgi:hypothetical protein